MDFFSDSNQIYHNQCLIVSLRLYKLNQINRENDFKWKWLRKIYAASIETVAYF